MESNEMVAVENQEAVTESLETRIIDLQDQLLAMITEEDTLREAKCEAAASFRRQIATIRQARRKVQKELAKLQKEQYEEEGTEILDTSDTESPTVEVNQTAVSNLF
jgi:uncharacterized protein YigA (DUF484 family)